MEGRRWKIEDGRWNPPSHIPYPIFHLRPQRLLILPPWTSPSPRQRSAGRGAQTHWRGRVFGRAAALSVFLGLLLLGGFQGNPSAPCATVIPFRRRPRQAE